MLAAETIERRVELTHVPQGWYALGSVALLAILFYAIVFFYRRDGRSAASGRLRIGLAAIRCTVLALLAAVWLEPVLATYISRKIESITLLLVDGSASMSVHDRYPQPDDLRHAQRALQGITGVHPTELTRADLTRIALTRDGEAVLKRLAAANPVQICQFGDKLTPLARITADSLSASAGIPSRTDRSPSTQPSAGKSERESGGAGERAKTSTQPTGGDFFEIAEARAPVTDIGRAVRQAIESQSGAPIAAVVVISDGRFNQGEPAEVIARYARAKKTPIYAVGVGDPSPPRNVAVTSVEAPANVFVADPFKVIAHLQAQGLDDVPLTVQLTERTGTAAAGTVVETKTARVRPGGVIDPVVFNRQIGQASEVTLQVRVTPEPGESITTDNQKEVTVRALDAKMRVLLVSGGPTWEYRYLTHLLERDATVNVSCWLQSADEGAVRDGTTIIDHFPRTQEELFPYDCIILLDPQPGEIDPAWTSNIEALVGSYGGGLLYVAGRKNASRFAHDAGTRSLLDLLPVVIEPNESDLIINELGHFQTTAWPLTVPPEAAASPVLALSDTPGENAQIWARLPGVYWHYPVRREKPVATVLLRHSNPRMRNSYGGHVLLASQFFGSGRTAFLGFDTTWRWRRYGDAYFNRFWIQLLRHLVEGKLLSGQKRGLIQVEREGYSVGDAVVIEARLLDTKHLPMTAERVPATVRLEGKPDAPLNLTAQPNRPGWYRGQFTAADVGTHVVQIDLPGGEGAQSASLRAEIRVGRPDLEFRQPELDRASLEALATGSAGGKYLNIDELSQLPNLIPSKTTTLVVTGQPVTLWDRWWTFALLAGLLTTEWTLRKKARML
jgi:hypothetical protein